MPDPRVDAALRLLREGRCKSAAQAARNTGAKTRTVSENWQREREGRPTSSHTIEVEGELPSSWTPDELLKAHGFDPQEWAIARSRVNRWGDPDEPSYQLRFDVVPSGAIVEIKAPDPDRWKAPAKPRRATGEAPLKAVVISDHHAPHHEKTFHRLFLDYLADEQPDIIEVNGDLLDFSTISRHREIESHASPVNDCLQAGYEILADYRHTCPDALIRYKRGNHSERLRAYLMDNARALHGITAADEDLPALSLQRLLRLDEIHVEYIDEEWEHAVTKLSPKLRVRHGFTTSKNGAAVVLDRLSGSTVQGHDHRLWVALRTEHEDDELRVRMAMSAGCACEIPGGLGYAVQPDWQNAFGAFRIYPDGDFHPGFGIYVEGRLLAPNGKRYQ